MFLYSIAGEDNDFDLILNDTDDPNYTQGFVRIKKLVRRSNGPGRRY